MLEFNYIQDVLGERTSKTFTGSGEELKELENVFSLNIRSILDKLPKDCIRVELFQNHTFGEEWQVNIMFWQTSVRSSTNKQTALGFKVITANAHCRRKAEEMVKNFESIEGHIEDFKLSPVCSFFEF